ncbi:MAG: hypothetical protein HeimC3_03770 [Candidatus Heimdallarchaeota archaeon LC_3]|nr:MAG: hypothetical protein HeimC3_03770 [Candidatus Heimdallarchaeota archaeon LC_3]
MHFQSLNISLSRSINLSDDRTESITIKYEIQIDENEDNPQEVYSSVYRLINLQLNSWERELRQETQKNLFLSSEPPPITTAASMINNVKNNHSKSDQEIKCPKCNEVMFQKDGKTYFSCLNGHWGYLEMIKKGEVR